MPSRNARPLWFHVARSWKKTCGPSLTVRRPGGISTAAARGARRLPPPARWWTPSGWRETNSWRCCGWPDSPWIGEVSTSRPASQEKCHFPVIPSPGNIIGYRPEPTTAMARRSRRLLIHCYSGSNRMATGGISSRRFPAGSSSWSAPSPPGGGQTIRDEDYRLRRRAARPARASSESVAGSGTAVTAAPSPVVWPKCALTMLKSNSPTCWSPLTSPSAQWKPLS